MISNLISMTNDHFTKLTNKIRKNKKKNLIFLNVF